MFTFSVHGKEWVPQLGTVAHPKLPHLSPDAKKSDVYRLQDNKLYVAEASGHVDHLASNNLWKELPSGTFRNPKVLDKNQIISKGEVFHDQATGKYFRSTCIPKVGIATHSQCLEEVNVYADWMGLMKQEINDTRLGDLAVPASHDTATSGINEDSYLVDQNFLFRLGDLVVPEVLVNWSLTQDMDVLAQLEAGFRQFDLRVADCLSFNDTFRWWHGLSGN